MDGVLTREKRGVNLYLRGITEVRNEFTNDVGLEGYNMH